MYITCLLPPHTVTYNWKCNSPHSKYADMRLPHLHTSPSTSVCLSMCLILTLHTTFCVQIQLFFTFGMQVCGFPPPPPLDDLGHNLSLPWYLYPPKMILHRWGEGGGACWVFLYISRFFRPNIIFTRIRLVHIFPQHSTFSHFGDFVII